MKSLKLEFDLEACESWLLCELKLDENCVNKLILLARATYLDRRLFVLVTQLQMIIDSEL